MDKKEYIVRCKDTMVDVNLFRLFLTTSMGLNKVAQRKAETLYMMASAMPDVPAGVLLDLVTGKLQYEIDDEAQTFTILGVTE